MPTPRRSRGNHPRTPRTNTFKSCSSCGSRNSIRRITCSSCGTSVSKRKPNRGSSVSSRRRAITRQGAMSAGDSESLDNTMETSFDSQETMATTPDEGSAASSPQSNEPHSSHNSPPSQLTARVTDDTSLPSQSPHPPQSSPPPLRTIPEEQIKNSPIPPPLETSTSHSSGDVPSLPFLESQHANFPEDQSHTTHTPASQSTHVTPSTPTQLPDFLLALKMRPTGSASFKTDKISNSAVSCDTSTLPKDSANLDGIEERKIAESTLQEGDGGPIREGDGEKMDTEGDDSSLAERFKKDPNAVLDLLRSALSMDKLSQLIGTEYSSNSTQLVQLQTRLEAAYHTLKDCSEHKADLTKTIDETNNKIKGKRKHLEELRDDLKVLGEEELHLKKRRDNAYSRCSQLKQKLKASRDALQQISALAPGRTESVVVKETN